MLFAPPAPPGTYRVSTCPTPTTAYTPALLSTFQFPPNAGPTTALPGSLVQFFLLSGHSRDILNRGGFFLSETSDPTIRGR